MKLKAWLWIVAFVLTAASALYQRMTGPTYPVSGSVTVNGQIVRFTLDRSHGGQADHEVRMVVPDTSVRGVVRWKRFKTADAWRDVIMGRRGDTLAASLPGQPPAGKLEYVAELKSGESTTPVPPDGPVIIRFKGDVPLAIILPHVLAMFLAMFLSTRAGLETLVPAPKLRALTLGTLVALVLGGAILGPLMQKYAFDAYWTGWPFGQDMTDNKTLLALLGWLAAAIALRRARSPKRWVLAASLLLFLVYLIPHSVLGSELDYSVLDRQGTTRTK